MLPSGLCCGWKYQTQSAVSAKSYKLMIQSARSKDERPGKQQLVTLVTSPKSFHKRAEGLRVLLRVVLILISAEDVTIKKKLVDGGQSVNH